MCTYAVEREQPRARVLRDRPHLNYANDGALLALAAAVESGESPDGGDALRPVRARPADAPEPPSGALAALGLRADDVRVVILANHQHTSGASAVVANVSGGQLGTIDEALGWGALASPSPNAADARRQSPYAPLEGNRGDVGAFGQAFDQIGVRELLGLDGWSFHQMGTIPVALREPFALALVDVLSALEDAISQGNLVGRDRALKALALLPTLLLRLPPPGSDKMTTHGAIVYERIGKWTRGDIDALVQELASDAYVNETAAAAATAGTGRSNLSGDAASKIRTQATKLIRMGDLGRARRVITSSGCADLRDPAVVAELAAKYPQARQPVDTTFLDEPDFPRVNLDKAELAKVCGKLDPLTAQGVSGWRNPYITAVSLVGARRSRPAAPSTAGSSPAGD